MYCTVLYLQFLSYSIIQINHGFVIVLSLTSIPLVHRSNFTGWPQKICMHFRNLVERTYLILPSLPGKRVMSIGTGV